MHGARWKRRLVAALIVSVLVWPALQHVLVRHTDADPWYLFGFAMYCVPHRVLDMQYGQLVDGELRSIDPRRVTPELRFALENYLRIYGYIGTLGSRADLIERLLAAAPEAERIVLIFRQLQLDVASGALGERCVAYGFDRDAPGRLLRLEDEGSSPCEAGA